MVINRDEEKDRLRQQLKVAHEQLEVLKIAPRSPATSQTSRPNSYASVASSTASENADDLVDGK